MKKGKQMTPKLKAEDPVVRTSIYLPQSLLLAVRHAAVDERLSMTEWILRAVREYMKKGGRS